MALNNANNLTNCKLVVDELVTPYDNYMTYRFKRTLYSSSDIVQRLRQLAHRLRVALSPLLPCTRKDETISNGDDMINISTIAFLLNKLIEPLSWLERVVLINGALSPTVLFATKAYIFVAVLITIAHAFVLIYNSEIIRKKIAKLVVTAQNNVNNLTDCKIVVDELIIPYNSYMTYRFKRTLYSSSDIVQRLRQLAHRLRVALDLRHGYLVNRPFA